MRPAVAWLGWVGAILVILSTSRNPWYILLILAWISIVLRTVRRAPAEAAPMPVSIVRFGAMVVGFSAVFNALSVHFGDTVLFSIAEAIPFFGGPVTLEALVYGAINGLILTGLLAAFAVFKQAVSVRSLIQLVPRAFFPVAVMTSIAITFVPATLRQYQAIREAQAVRGHRLRGLRDWAPLVVPLFVGGLERAFQLAEAMTARGFAGTADTTQTGPTRLMILTGLVLVTAGWLLRLVWRQPAVGLGLLLAGVGVMAGAIWWAGRRVPRTTYRPQPWTGYEWGIILGAAAACLSFGLRWPGLDRSSIFFYPYPKLTWPTVQPWLLFATLGLLAPALLTRFQPTDSTAEMLTPARSQPTETEYDSV